MNISPSDMLWAIINFLILVAVLNKFLYKPLLGLLENRKKEIQEKYDQAEAAKSDAGQMKEEYAREMQTARQQAQDILEKATRLGEATKDEIVKQARDESAKITQKAKEAIRQEKDQAISQLREEVATLAIMAAGKVIDKSMKKEDHEKLIQEFIKEVGDAS